MVTKIENRDNEEFNLADLNLEISFLFLKIRPSRSGFAKREAHADEICFEKVSKVVDSSFASGSICPWISVASCFNGVEPSGHNDFPKSL